MNWAPLYGPALSFDFGRRWSFSNTFMSTDQYHLRPKYVSVEKPNVL